MKRLSGDQYEKARKYIRTQARPLERALFEHHFEGASVENALMELAKFQNSDGGFGRALEPDMRAPSSSALATEVGLRTLVELGAASENPMVVSTICYLLNALDPQAKTWRVVPLDVNDHPHAPWWHDEAGSLVQAFDDFLVIPRAGILASLHYYPELLPGGWLGEMTEITAADIMAMDDEKFGGGGDALVYARRLAEAPGLPDDIQRKLVEQVISLADRVVARDPASWSQYSAPPLKLAPSPQSITADLLADCLPAHLDYLVDSQAPEGFWDVTWAWSGYPDEWETAKTEWRGILTLDALSSLKAFERME